MVKKTSEGPGSNKLEFISNKKTRRTIFKYRKNSLVKKIQELSILCGIDVGAIIFPSDADAEHVGQDGGKQKFVWPQDQTKIQELVGLYKAKAGRCDLNPPEKEASDPADSCQAGDSSSGFAEDNKKAKQGTSWHPRYDDLSAEQLNELVQVVEKRIGAVNNKIDLLRKSEGMRGGRICSPGQNQPEMICNLFHRCRHAARCCCRRCGMVDPGCSSHHEVNMTVHGTCNCCLQNEMVISTRPIACPVIYQKHINSFEAEGL